MYLKIQSKGLIDPKAFSLMGASTKRDDSTKIGLFGSGLKYSIAYLLRNKINFRIFSGLKEITFSIEEQDFRNRKFGVISINKEQTSLTTDMGPTWVMWEVLREIYCNSIDEGDGKIETVDGMIPEDNKTIFFIEINKDIEDIVKVWDRYFSEKRRDLLYSKEDCRLYSGDQEIIIYRKGIRCYFVKIQSIFHYDLGWIEINESRIIKSDWDFRWALRNFLQKISDVKIIKQFYRILDGKKDFYEFDLTWDCEIQDYSDIWFQAIENRTLVSYESAGMWTKEIENEPCLILPTKMVKGLSQRFPEIKVIGDYDEDLNIKVFDEHTEKEKFMLKSIKDFFKECNYEVNYPVKICEFGDSIKIGCAKDKRIYISKKVFDMGTRVLAETIVEENEHLISGYEDETRGFQNHLIRKFMSQMEERYAHFL